MTWLDPPPREIILPLLVIGAIITMPLASLAGPASTGDFSTQEHGNDGVKGYAASNVAPDPNDADAWTVGTCENGVRVNFTADGGSTWNTHQVSSFIGNQAPCIVARHPTDSDRQAIAYATFDNFDVRVAVTTDGWSTSTDVTPGDVGTELWPILLAWKDTDTLSLVTYDDANGALRASNTNDTGTTWDAYRTIGNYDSTNSVPKFNAGVGHQLDSDTDWLRLLEEDGTYVSTDGGLTWSGEFSTNLTSGNGIAWAPITKTNWIALSSQGGGSPDEILETTDAGQTWTTVHTLEDDNHDPQMCDVQTTDFWACVYLNATDDGVEMAWSEDQGSTWTEVEPISCNFCDQVGIGIGSGRYLLNAREGGLGSGNYGVSAWTSANVPAGLDTFTPADADQEDTTTWFNIGHLETDWTNDTASHEVYVRGLTGIQGTDNEVRLRVYNPSLDQVRQTNACAAFGYAEARSMQTRHTLTRETNERVVYPCDQMGDPQQDAFILINGTSFDLVNDGDLDAVMSDPWTPTVTSCNSPTRCITDAAEDNQVVKWDALNMQSNWIKPLSVEDVAADKNGNDRYGIVGGFGERVYGPSGNVIANGPGFGTLIATALFNATTLYGGDQNAVVKMTCSGSSCTTSAINNTLGTVEHGLRLSKDGNYIMALSPNRERVSIYDTTDLSRIVDANMGETVKGFDMDLTNTYLYVAEDTDLYRFDLTGTNVTQNTATPPEAPAQTGNVTSNVTTPTGSGQPSFDTILEQQAASAFNVDAVGAGWILGGLFIVILSLAGAAMLGNAGVQTQTGATVGAVGGLALSIAFNWIPIWFVVVLGLIAAAFVVSRRG